MRISQRKNWTFNVKSLLQNLGLNYVWNSQNVNDIDHFINLVRQIIKDQFLTTWRGSLSASPDGKLYSLYKVNFAFSEYLNYVNNIKDRSALVRFLTKNYNIPVVTGKWLNRRPYAERLCAHCGVLGDELHFVFECKSNIVLREKYISAIYCRKPTKEKFIKFLTCGKKDKIRGLARFLRYSLKLLE